MKNFIFILFLLPIIGFAQNEFDASLAQVNKVSGKYIFLNCEPVNEYEVVYEVKAFALSFSGIDDITDIVLKKAFKMKKKEGKDFDALIIGSSKFDLAVNFK
jgi:hypothetical protein